jgi:hypothetical protein
MGMNACESQHGLAKPCYLQSTGHSKRADKYTCLEQIFKHYPNVLTVFSVPKDANKRPWFKIRVLEEMGGEVAKNAKSFPAELATEASI